MTTSRRAPIFNQADDDLDLSDFQPKPAQVSADPAKIAQLSQAVGFGTQHPPVDRRPRTGRDVQINFKAKAVTVDRFRQVGADQGWSLAITLERALDALMRELARREQS